MKRMRSRRSPDSSSRRHIMPSMDSPRSASCQRTYTVFDLESSHVLPAMIRRFHEARLSGAPEVTLWGTGTPRREFLHVDDLANAACFLMENYDAPELINVGAGEELTIAELAVLVAQAVGYTGRIVFDPSRPDGTPRKLLDLSRIQNLGWHARIPLERGVASPYQWYLSSASLEVSAGESLD